MNTGKEVGLSALSNLEDSGQYFDCRSTNYGAVFYLDIMESDVKYSSFEGISIKLGIIWTGTLVIKKDVGCSRARFSWNTLPFFPRHA